MPLYVAIRTLPGVTPDALAGAGARVKTCAALALLVARAALTEGHQVSVFLAGDAALLIRDAVLDNLAGLGTGKARDHVDALVAGGARFYVSGMSAKARGLSEADLAGKSAEFAMPDMLVRLSLSHDRMFTYWPPVNHHRSNDQLAPAAS